MFYTDRTDGKTIWMSMFLESEIDFSKIIVSNCGEYRVQLSPTQLSSNIEERPTGGEINWIEIVNPFEYDNIRRDAIATVIHRREGSENHCLRFVLDLNNHGHNGDLLAPHVNVRGEDEAIMDGECSECQAYFESWDHMEICFENHSSRIKRADWERTYQQLEEKLLDSGFFEDYEVKVR